MKFRFCGDSDCPDWILAEINTISKLSSVKLRSFAKIVAQGISNSAIDMEKVEKLFADSKLDSTIDFKACAACLSFIISSTIRYNCTSTFLQSELQQLGLPREHSAAIKRIVDEFWTHLSTHFEETSLKVNALNDFHVEHDPETNCSILNLNIGRDKTNQNVVLPKAMIQSLIVDLKRIEEKIKQLQQN